MALTYPWNETAVLVHDEGGGIRRVVGEGTLRQIVRRLGTTPKANWHAYRIALPERGCAPFIFDQDEFAKLISMQTFE